MKNNLMRNVLLWLVVSVACYAVIGFLVVPLIARPVMEKKLSGLLGHTLSLESLRINPFALSATLRGLNIAAKDDPGTLISATTIYVNVESRSILKKALVISSMRIDGPFVHIVRDPAGSLNLMNLGTADHDDTSGENTPAPTSSSGNALPLQIESFSLTGGTVRLTDQAMETPFDTSFRSITVTVLGFLTDAGKPARCKLSLASREGEHLRYEGSLGLFPLTSEGVVEISGFIPGKYAPYYEKALLFSIEEGSVDLSTRYLFRQNDTGGAFRLTDLGTSVHSLRLLRQGEEREFLLVPSFEVRDTTVDFKTRHAEVGTVETTGGNVLLKRLEKGDFNLAMLTPEPPPDQQAETPEDQKAQSPSWTLGLGKVSLDHYTLAFEDYTTEEPFVTAAKDLTATIDSFSTVPGSTSRIAVSFTEPTGGTFSAEGTLGMKPFLGNLAFTVGRFHLPPLQPYIGETMALTIRDGALSLEGAIQVSRFPEKPLELRASADVTLTDFSSVDRETGEELFSFASLAIDDLDFSYTPHHLTIGGISLSDVYSLLTIHEDGRLNVLTLFGKKASASPEPPEPSVAQTVVEGREKTPFFTVIEIGSTSLQGGRIDFTDRSIQPFYSAQLTDIRGTLSAISSKEITPADIAISGALNKTVSLSLTGTINPLQKEFSADLTLVSENLELSSLTPYSKKFIGHGIDKGKLFLDLEYKIDKGTLDSQNKILFDQFFLGDKEESPGAINLPVGLAVSLLRNREGDIDLDVPVSGSLDDPEFGIGYFIIKIITNIIEKAVASPFALLGSIAGGGEELGYVEFDYGSTDLSDAAAKKLALLEQALYERPSLNLEIIGHVDMEGDVAHIRQGELLKKIKAAKQKTLAAQGLQPQPIEATVVLPEEYETYARLAYEAEAPSEGTPPATIDEIEAALRQSVTVADETLRNLASVRASTVRDQLLRSGVIAKERLFLLEPDARVPVNLDSVPESRVDFELRQ